MAAKIDETESENQDFCSYNSSISKKKKNSQIKKKLIKASETSNFLQCLKRILAIHKTQIKHSAFSSVHAQLLMLHY